MNERPGREISPKEIPVDGGSLAVELESTYRRVRVQGADCTPHQSSRWRKFSGQALENCRHDCEVDRTPRIHR